MFSKGVRLNVSLADLSALKVFAKISLCFELLMKAHVVKSQSGPCRRRFLCFYYYYYYLFLDNILKCFLLHHLAELLSLNFFPLAAPSLG